ncbi:putative endonuclease [Roseovarius sp. EC-HK134]|nr:putative endonuclease [Roseovarius sp. EC-SD190]VVT33704.1 putative endonuclease [Roseovarius sp. EC-HK134]
MRQDCGMTHFVYIMASRPCGALYTGRTHDLRSRVAAHRAGLSAHTAKYNIRRLVWFEPQDDFETSLRRERSIKRWHRAWKIALITSANPDWRDIATEIPDL